MRLLRRKNNKNNIYNYEQTLRGGQTHATRVTSLCKVNNMEQRFAGTYVRKW